MDSIELIGFPIRVSNSTVFKHCFITFATPIGLVDAKVNCYLENYKYGRYIDYCNLCQFFLVKTRENWILKDFIRAEKIFDPQHYTQFEQLADIVKLMQKNFKKTDENFLPLINQISNDFTDNNPIGYYTKIIEDYV
jgi:hypothetical protein